MEKKAIISGARWVFFDLGSTLVDEGAVYRARYAALARLPGIIGGD